MRIDRIPVMEGGLASTFSIAVVGDTGDNPDRDLPTLAQEVAAVTERAKARWEETPKHPVYARPTPPARGRNRRQQGEAEQEQAQTPRLF